MLGVLGVVAVGGGLLATQLGGDGESSDSDGDPSGTSTSSESNTLFLDEFDDGTFEDTWEFQQGNGPDDDTVEERDGVLYHQSPKAYTNGADLYTRESFEATGTVELRAVVQSYLDDYWGFGWGISFEDGGGFRLKEHKWARNDRFIVRFTIPGADNEHVRLAEPTSPAEPTEYTCRLDFDERVVRDVTRGSETFDQEIPFPETIESSRYSLYLGNGRGHEVEFDSVRLSSV